MFIKLTAGKLKKIKWLNREKATYIENIEKNDEGGGPRLVFISKTA